MSTFIEHFHFIRPFWLIALIPALVLFVRALQLQSQASEWQSEISPHLLPFLLEGEQSSTNKLPFYLLLLIWLMAGIALAGPTWEKIAQPLKKDSSALVVLFDLSPSMNVQDVAPSRLVRARLKLIDLLDTRKEGLTALVAYAGEAHVVTPLTDDVDTIKNLIPSLSPHTMPIPGSNAEMALEQANTLLKDAGIEHGNILFITDGIASSALNKLRKHYKEYGHKISLWGFGTTEGAPIQLTEGGFARSRSGEIIVAKLNHEELNAAAVAMNGVYIPFTDTQNDIEAINSYGLNPLSNQQREVEREFDQWVEFGPWLVLLCLPFVALSFRRGLVLSLFLVFAIHGPNTANAQSVADETKSAGGFWNNLWHTPNQQAQKALDEGRAEEAAQLFTTPEGKGMANYRIDNFEEAAEFFKQSENSSEAYYNAGTALTHAGKYDDAIAAYDKALELQPDYAAARNNKNITEKLKTLEQQQQQDQQQQDQQKNDQQQDKNQESQQQNSENQQGENQQSENQESQQGQNQDQAQQEQAQQDDSQNDDSQQEDSQQREASKSENEVDEEKAKQDYQEQLAQAQQEQEERQEKEAQESKEAQAQKQEENQQVYIDPEEQASNEEQQKLEHLLRRVPDDPGRLLRNKFRYETQQRKLEADSSKWNTPENSEEQRW